MIVNPFKVMPSIPASTRILMPFTTTSGLTDVAGGHAITITGTPSISTGRSKFGQGSLLVTSGSYLRIDSTPTLDVSANKAFTFEFWVYCTTDGGLLSMRDTADYAPMVLNKGYVLIGNAALSDWAFISNSLETDQWIHVALVFDGANIKEYINGIQTGEVVTHPNWAAGNRFLYIGNDVFGLGGAECSINDLRISNTAIYTANFTPPTAALT